MNWKEFVEVCEQKMADAGIRQKGTDVIVRVEVGDSYYDANVTSKSIYISDYTGSPHEPGMYLVIFGGQ